MIKEILVGIIMTLIVLAVGFYVFQEMDTNIKEHPEVTQIGAPLEFNWVAFVIASMLSFIVAVVLTATTDEGINPGARQP